MRQTSDSKKCEGSGEWHYATWLPDSEGYPGAGLCVYCSGGVQFVKKSVHKVVHHVTGQETYEGRLKSHKKAE